MYAWEDKKEDFYELGTENSLALTSKVVKHLTLDINITQRRCLNTNIFFCQVSINEFFEVVVFSFNRMTLKFYYFIIFIIMAWLWHLE